jgi:hypothetical protein
MGIASLSIGDISLKTLPFLSLAEELKFINFIF